METQDTLSQELNQVCLALTILTSSKKKIGMNSFHGFRKISIYNKNHLSDSFL